MAETRILRRLASIRERQQERMREEAAKLQAQVRRLADETDDAKSALIDRRQAVAAANVDRHHAMQDAAASRRRFGALVTRIDGDKQALAKQAEALEALRAEHRRADEARIAHNKRLNRVRRQCQGLEKLIGEAETAAEISAELQQD